MASKENTCNVADLGCTIAGQKQLTPAGVVYVTTTIKNDPAAYAQTLCTEQAEGCDAFNYRGGAMYFKDPVLMGQQVCAYRLGVDVAGVKSNGWFWKNVGKCGVNDVYSNYCTGDQDCAGTDEKCEKKGDWPCYPNYRFNDINYGLWSYGVQDKYQNFVGECPAEQSGCTEYVDHNDNNKAHYFIDNDKLKAAQANCNGQVSQRYGCILLDNTELPNKIWNTTSSYTASKQNNFALVAPVSAAQNDANLIVKVVRDRGCAEWLQCQNSHREWDWDKGVFKTVCDGVGRCNRLTATTEQSDATECGSWVNGAHDYAGALLTDSIYRGRDISWGGHDYSGYSIWGQYPAEELEQMNLSDIATSSQWSLVKRIPCGGVNCAKNATPEDFTCENDGAYCGAGREGICENQICAQTPNGSNNSSDFDSANANSPVRQYCRAYPESDSPFPNNVDLSTSQTFARANKCSESFNPTSNATLAGACDCYYQKVNYGDFTTKFWNFYKPNDLGGGTPKASPAGASPEPRILTGVCVSSGEAGPGGGKDGLACSKDEDCQINKDTPGGTCARKTKQQKFIGRSGFCLEFDESKTINNDPNQHPCLTWLPVEQLSGVPDANNQFVDAGFNPQGMGYSVGPFYFVSTERWEERKTFKVIVSGFIDCDGHENWEKDPNLKTGGPYAQCDTDGSGSLPSSCWNNDPDQAYAGILKYCWNPDCTGADGSIGSEPIKHLGAAIPYPSIVCPENYKPANLTKFVQACREGKGCQVAFTTDGVGVPKNPCGSGDDEDWIKMEYDCKPVNGEGWYKDPLPGSLLTVPYTIPFGWRGRNKNIIPLDQDDKALSPVEKEEWRGVTLYSIADTTGNKAYTNRLWPDTDYSYWHNNAGSIPYDKGCSPYGASALNSAPQNGDIVQEGACNKSPQNRPASSQKVYQGGVEHEKDRLQNIFAKSYGRYIQGSTALGGGACVGADPVVGNPVKKSCANDANCQPNLCSNVGGGENVIDSDNGPGSFCLTTGRYGTNDNKFCGENNVSDAAVSCMKPWKDYPCDDGSTYYYCGSSCYGDCPYDTLQATPQTASCAGYSVPGREKLTGNFDSSVNWDTSPTAGKSAPPVILPVLSGETDCKQNPNGSGQLCKEGDPGAGFTINNKTSGDVKVTGKPAKINLKFYAYADKDHMPLRRVMIDWGDGNIAPREGYFRNHRGARPGVCKPPVPAKPDERKCYGFAYQTSTPPLSEKDEYKVLTNLSCWDDTDCKFVPQCVNADVSPFFSFMLDKTCDSNYFYSEKTYGCQKGGPNYEANCGGGAYAAEFPEGCCIYQPKVQVLDNWGWCNGTCAPDIGCYGSAITGETYGDCDNSLSPRWTSFGGGTGKVYVKPL